MKFVIFFEFERINNHLGEFFLFSLGNKWVKERNVLCYFENLISFFSYVLFSCGNCCLVIFLGFSAVLFMACSGNRNFFLHWRREDGKLCEWIRRILKFSWKFIENETLKGGFV